MKLTDIFVRRPVLAITVNLLILIAGIQAILNVNVRQYPRTESSTVTITTIYTGASADLVRGFITAPIERAIAAADGIDYIESSSSLGISTVTANLRLNYDGIRALSEISAKVDQVRGDLPPEAEVPVINIEPADSRFASAYLSFSSDRMAANEITDYLVRVVQPRLSSLEGVQRADILGARTFAMRIWLKPDRMAALNVTPVQVRAALANNSYLSALGRTKGSYIQVNLTANTDLRSVDEYRQLPIREEGGSVIRLGDIADVVLGAENYEEEVRFSGERAVFMGVWVLPNANSLDVIERVRSVMPSIEEDLPRGMSGRIAYDATGYINDAIHEVVKTLLETLLIVVVVIFLFLGNLRSVLVPIVAIPISLIGAVFLMQAFGFTLNLLTLLAIVLAVGLVVDDAIVVVENVERHLRMGRTPFSAAILGARELISPIISMTLTLAAVYAPIGLQGGLTGALFREFAFTLAGAVIISGIVALTLSPMMASKLLTAESEHQGLAARINSGFDRLREAYGRILDDTLRHRPAIYLAAFFLAVLAVPLYIMSARELAPTEDQGIIFGIMETPANSTVDQTVLGAEAANRVMMAPPESAYTFQITGATFGFGGLVLKPWGERERTVFEVQPEVQAGLSQIPGIQMFSVVPPALPSAGQFPVEIVIASTAEAVDLVAIASELAKRAAESGMFAFPPIIDLKIDQPQAELLIDREKVAAFGLDLREVGSDVSAMLGGAYVNRFSVAGRSYRVIPQVERAARLNPEQIADIHVTGPEGNLIPLSSVATLRNSTEPRSLTRFNQLNSVKLSGLPIVPLDRALTFLEDEANKIKPAGYIIDYTGESRQLRVEGNRFLPALILALILIILVLAAQFNSFRDPFIIILGSVPLAMTSALIFTFLRMPNTQMPFWTDGWTTTLNIYSQVGLITLIGLVSKNGILIVEFANQLQLAGKSKLDAVREASRTRLRPILMTSVATVFGHLPLVFVTGAGAEARNSIGITLVAGMAIGTVFTLFIVPSLYMLIAKEKRPDTRVVQDEGEAPAQA